MQRFVLSNRLLITNNTGSSLSNIRIEIAGRNLHLGGLEPGQHKTMIIALDDDSHVDLSWEEEGQTLIEKNCGYTDFHTYGTVIEFSFEKSAESATTFVKFDLTH
jgi:hypothetical protein